MKEGKRIFSTQQRNLIYRLKRPIGSIVQDLKRRFLYFLSNLLEKQRQPGLLQPKEKIRQWKRIMSIEIEKSYGLSKNSQTRWHTMKGSFVYQSTLVFSIIHNLPSSRKKFYTHVSNDSRFSWNFHTTLLWRLAIHITFLLKIITFKNLLSRLATFKSFFRIARKVQPHLRWRRNQRRDEATPSVFNGKRWFRFAFIESVASLYSFFSSEIVNLFGENDGGSETKNNFC